MHARTLNVALTCVVSLAACPRCAWSAPPRNLAPQSAARTSTEPEVRIEMELGVESGLSPTASRDWFQILTELKVGNLRLRSGEAAEKLSIADIGTPAVRGYKVTGAIVRGNVLVLPGARFQTADKAKLAEWLTRLRQEGPDRAAGAPRLPFGLGKEQLAAVLGDLGRPVDFSTDGLALKDFLNRVAKQVRHPLAPDPAAFAPLHAAPALDVELRGLALGTAMAYALDPAGLALVARQDARQKPSYVVVLARGAQEQWPIGRAPRKPIRDLLPSLFDTVDVELDDVELSRVLEAVGEHLKVPVLTDRPELARQKIDLAKTRVSFPAKQSMYEIVLNKVLIPKFLDHEIRVDDGERPFVWIKSGRAPQRQTAEKPS